MKRVIYIYFGTKSTEAKVKNPSDCKFQKDVSARARFYDVEATQWIVTRLIDNTGKKSLLFNEAIVTPIALLPEADVDSVKKLLLLLSGDAPIVTWPDHPEYMKSGEYEAQLVPSMNADMVNQILSDKKNSQNQGE